METLSSMVNLETTLTKMVNLTIVLQELSTRRLGCSLVTFYKQFVSPWEILEQLLPLTTLLLKRIIFSGSFGYSLLLSLVSSSLTSSSPKLPLVTLRLVSSSRITFNNKELLSLLKLKDYSQYGLSSNIRTTTQNTSSLERLRLDHKLD